MKRYLAACVAATVITVGLFLGMESLIAMADADLRGKNSGRIADFVRLRRDTSVQNERRQLPERRQPKAPTPPPMQMPEYSSGGVAVAAPVETIAAPRVTHAVRLAGGPSAVGAPSDTMKTPLVRVEPQYPPRAAERGVEGWVEVGFTVTADGGTTDVRVIAADPPGVFNRAAIKAVRRWKYKPEVVDGKAVPTPGQRVRFELELRK